MSGFEVYLWLHLIPVFGTTFIILGSIALSIIIGVVIAGWTGEVTRTNDYCARTWSSKEGKEKAKKWWKAIPVALFILMVGLVCPSRKTIVLCYVIPAIANSEIVADLPEDLHHLYSEGMDRLIELVEVSEDNDCNSK